MAERWWSDPQYSHGFLVPGFAAVLLWVRRPLRPRGAEARPNWWGLAMVLAGVALRLAGVHYYFPWLDGFSLLPVLAGLFLVVGGWPALRWAWPAVAFLLFMLPLPYRVETALSQPLRHLATAASTFVLQTVGFPALSEGNVILVGNSRIGVEEACSGLSMLITFFALTTAVAVVVRRPWIDRVLIVASAVPIALAANVARITATGAAHEFLGTEAGNAVFHKYAGWMMMVLALGLLWLEIRCLDLLLVERAADRPVPVGLPPRTLSGAAR